MTRAVVTDMTAAVSCVTRMGTVVLHWRCGPIAGRRLAIFRPTLNTIALVSTVVGSSAAQLRTMVPMSGKRPQLPAAAGQGHTAPIHDRQ